MGYQTWTKRPSVPVLMNVAAVGALIFGGCGSNDGDSSSDVFPAVPSSTDSQPADCETDVCDPMFSGDGSEGSEDSGTSDGAASSTSGAGSTGGEGPGTSTGSQSDTDPTSGSGSGSGTGAGTGTGG